MAILVAYQAIILFAACFIIVLDFEFINTGVSAWMQLPLCIWVKKLHSRAILAINFADRPLSGHLFGRTLFAYRYFKPRSCNVSTIILADITSVDSCYCVLCYSDSWKFWRCTYEFGFVYFHDSNVFANHAAVNVVWNFLYAVQKMNRLKYSDSYFDKAKTEQYFQQLFPTPDSTATSSSGRKTKCDNYHA